MSDSITQLLTQLKTPGGQTVLLRLSPSNTKYSEDGTTWYPVGNTTTGGSGSGTLPFYDVDGSTIKNNGGILTAVQELPSGGTVGQVLTKSGNSCVWSNPVGVGYTSGLIYDQTAKTVRVDIGSSAGQVVALNNQSIIPMSMLEIKLDSTIVLSNNKLHAVQELPDGGVVGQVLTKAATGVVWSALDSVTMPVFTGGLVSSGSSVFVDTGNTSGKVVVLSDGGKIPSSMYDTPIDSITIKKDDQGRLSAVHQLPASGSNGQFLQTLGGSNYVWVTPSFDGLPAGGSPGQYLGRTSSSAAWSSFTPGLHTVSSASVTGTGGAAMTVTIELKETIDTYKIQVNNPDAGSGLYIILDDNTLDRGLDTNADYAFRLFVDMTAATSKNSINFNCDVGTLTDIETDKGVYLFEADYFGNALYLRKTGFWGTEL